MNMQYPDQMQSNLPVKLLVRTINGVVAVVKDTVGLGGLRAIKPFGPDARHTDVV